MCTLKNRTFTIPRYHVVFVRHSERASVWLVKKPICFSLANLSIQRRILTKVSGTGQWERELRRLEIFKTLKIKNKKDLLTVTRYLNKKALKTLDNESMAYVTIVTYEQLVDIERDIQQILN